MTEHGRWRRLGRIGVVEGSAPWARTHAALPFAERDGSGHWRMYVSPRDELGRAHIGRCPLALGQTPRLGSLEASPVLAPGELGTFDDSGVTMSCVVAHGERRYLYYTGWSLGTTVPFYLATGLAVSDDAGATYCRVSRAPVLDRNDIDPYLTASPCVLIDEGRWRMWYVTATGWTRGEQPRHHYHIKYAESADGIHWMRSGHVCIDYADASEYAISRPCVVKDAGRYRMWFASRGERYTIGYAESRDGLTWTRRDDGRGLMPGGGEWEAEMVAYPWIVDDNGRRLMFYNGNGYGRTGIGAAEWEDAR